MRRELIIHIGDPKTGSTSIQKALASGIVQSPNAEIFYPAPLNHNGIAKSLMLKPVPLRPFPQVLKQMAKKRKFASCARKIKHSSAEINIISGENFCDVPPQTLKASIEKHFDSTRFNVRIIAYVRPHASRILSSYVEQIKVGYFSGTLEGFHQKFLKNRKIFYHARFQKWREVFGPAFTLRPFVRKELLEGCVVTDFLNYALQGKPFSLAKELSENSSLSLEDLMVIMEIQKLLPLEEPELRHAIGYGFDRILQNSPPASNGRKLVLHDDLAMKIRETYTNDAMATDETFFSGKPILQQALVAQTDDCSIEAQSILPGDYLSEAELRRLRMVSQLLSDTAGHQPAATARHLRNIWGEVRSPRSLKQ